MSHQPERRRHRSDDDLRAQREELQRLWNAKQQPQTDPDGPLASTNNVAHTIASVSIPSNGC
jgi:hypothetical protein